MTRAVETLLAQAMNLSAEERAELATKLAESIDEPMSPAWSAEIRRRVAAYFAGKSSSVSASDALAYAADPRRRQ